MEDLDKLSSKACKVSDWSEATDLAVERAMRENDKLKKEFDRINSVRREVKGLMAKFDLEEARDGLSVQECDLKLVDVEYIQRIFKGQETVSHSSINLKALYIQTFTCIESA